MNKFFRKHMNKLLAFFMAALLIVWLGGSALTNILSSRIGQQVLGQAVGGPVVSVDQQRAKFETDLLSDIGLNWQRPLFGGGDPIGNVEWILLTREAERSGVRVRGVEAEDFLNSIGATPELIQNLAKRRDIKVESYIQAVCKYMAIKQIAQMSLACGVRSEAEVRLAAQKELEKVRINVVALKADSFEDAAAEFSEDELQQQFLAYRDKEDEGGVKFGYRQPARVKVQYFKVDPKIIAEHLRVRESTLDRQAHDYWRKNRNNSAFRRPTQAADFVGPEQEGLSPTFDSFDGAREIALNKVRLQMAEAKMDDITGWLYRESSEPWLAAEAGDDGYKIGPADAVSASFYQKVLDRLPASLRYGDAITIAETDFFHGGNIAQKATEVSSGSVRLPGGGLVLFRNAAFNVQGLADMPDARRASTSEYVAVGQTFPHAMSVLGNIHFVFRVIDTMPAGPADSLDEVRNTVVKDLRTKRAYETVQQLAEEFVERSYGLPLKEAFESDSEMQEKAKAPSGYFAPEPFARLPIGSAGTATTNPTSYVAGVGQVRSDFVDQCFALEGSTEVAIIAVEDNALIAIVEFVSREPMRQDEYDKERTRILNQIARVRISRVASEWLEPQRVRDRMGFEEAVQ